MSSNPSEKSAVSFRPAFNGYNKEDVNKYIEEMNVKFTDTESEYKKVMLSQKKQIDELNLNLSEAKAGTDELFAAREQNKSIREELEKAENELGNALKKNSECTEVIGTLTDKLDQLSAKFALLTEDLNKIRLERDVMFDKVAQISGERDEINRKLQDVTENPVIKTPADELKAVIKTADPSDIEKARIYDKISRQVGSMLIDAREISDSIINDANIHAERIIISAENKAREICGDADIKLNHSVNYIKNTLKRMSSDFMSEYIEYINKSRVALDKFLGDTSVDADAVYTRFDTIINNTLHELNKGIDKIASNAIPKSADSANLSDLPDSSLFSE